MKLFILLSIPVIMFLPVRLRAQKSTTLLYQDKKTVFAKVPGQEGSNINLTLLIYTSEDIRLVVNASKIVNKKLGVYTDTVAVHELSALPIQNIIVETLKKDTILDSLQTASGALESQSLTTINLMVLAGQAFLTSVNNVDRNKLAASFYFKTKVPVYIDSKEKDKFFGIMGHKVQKDTGTILIKKTIKSLVQDTTRIKQSINEITTRIEKLAKSKQGSESGSANKVLLKANQDSILRIADRISKLQDDLRMIEDGSKEHFLIGYVFINKNELVINNGFAKTVRITLSDSMELLKKFEDVKNPFEKLNIARIIDYNFSLDIRSISSSQREINKYYALWKNTKHGLKYWLKLSDVFTYSPPDDTYLTELFVPKSQRIIFTPPTPVVIKVNETDINSVVRLNLFTDLVGIQEDQPNGLVQAEATFTTHLFNIVDQRNYHINRIFFFDHMEANLKFSKIENRLRYLTTSVDKDLKTPFIPNLQLLQYDNLETGVKLSIMKIESYKYSFNIYGSGGIVRTGLRDTLVQRNGHDSIKIPRTYNLLTLKNSAQAHLKIKATSYMGIDVSAEFILLTLLDNDVKQSGGNYSREGNKFKTFNYKQNIIVNPQFQVYYMPDKDESKRLYLRGAFFHDLGTKSNNFLTIQVGLSSDINKFLNFKTKE